MSRTLYIFNTTILTTPGLSYDSEIIDVGRARTIVKHFRGPIVSAVGHQATAEIATLLLDHDVPMSRLAAEMRPDDWAICVKLRQRAPEGVVLTREQVEAIGYDLVLLEARDPAIRRKHFREQIRITELLASLDDQAALEQEHTPGTRRRGNGGGQEHFIVRLPLVHDVAGYAEVGQDFGTGDWWVRDITAERARELYAERQYSVRT